MDAEDQNFYSPHQHTEQYQNTIIPGPDRKHSFFLPTYYKPFRFLGSGAFGVVCAATDLRIQNVSNDRERCVAIKKISLSVSNSISLKRYLRQMKILRILDNRSIIKLKNIVLPHKRQNFNDLYLVFEIMDSDLHEVIKKSSLTIFHIQYFSTKILEGMFYLHSCGILHRDLKPKNILVTRDNDLRISDFGLSRVVIEKGDPTLTDYVVTRWYRAPELILGFTDYSEAVDTWSIGCVIAEMLLGKPIFPGKSMNGQLKLIIQFTGFKVRQAECFGPETQEYLMKMFQRESEGNRSTLVEKNADGADLVQKMLKLNPKDRISLREALAHPFITSKCKPKIHQVKQPIHQIEFQFQYMQSLISIQQFKDMMYQQILLYHCPEFCENYRQRVTNGQSIIQHILSRYPETNKYEMDEQFDP